MNRKLYAIQSFQEVEAIAEYLLRQNEYCTVSRIRRHQHELVNLFGFEKFKRIIEAARKLRDSSDLGKVDPDARNKAAASLSLLRQRFFKGETYHFTITAINPYYVEDNYCGLHRVFVHADYNAKIGDTVVCRVSGYQKHSLMGTASLELKVLDVKHEHPTFATSDVIDQKTPEYWVGKISGLSKHRYGNSCMCSCCGKACDSKEAVKIDCREPIFFCRDCEKKVYSYLDRKGRSPIMFTGMTN